MTYRRLAAGLCGMMILALHSSGASADPRLTEAQTAQIATDFCQAIGQPVTGTPVLHYPMAEDPNEMHGYWLPRWSVKFVNEAELEIVDATGVVCGYLASDGSAAGGTRSASPPVNPISEQGATQRAFSVIAATGHSMDDLQLEDAEFEGGVGAEWTVAWRRVSGDIPYYLQGARVLLGAGTGAVRAMGINFASPPIPAVTWTITAEQGAAIARAQVTTVGLNDMLLESTTAEFRLPDSYWQNRRVNIQQGIIRPAWTYFFRGEYYLDCTVVVDAETGAVIGGTQGGPAMVISPGKIPSIRKLLEKAKEARVYRHTSTLKWMKAPLGALSATQEPQAFNLLQGLTPFSR